MCEVFTLYDRYKGIIQLLTGPKSDEFKMYLNRGQDDEMQFVCYKKCKIKTALTYLFFLLTAGVLRLVFHWIPHLYLKATSNRCKIEDAEKILITEVFNKNHKTYHVRPLQVLTPDSVAKMKKKDDLLRHQPLPDSDIVQALSVHFENGIFRDVDRLLMFSCKKVIYIWDSEKQEFVKLSGLDKGVPTDVFHKYKGLTSSEHFMRLKVYGQNLIDIKQQSFLTLVSLEVLNPFYIFQLLSFILWMVDDYYYYAACIMILTTGGVVSSALQTRKNQKNLKSTIHSSDVCTVLRRVPAKSPDEIEQTEYISETVSTELLVPGDIMEIPAHGCIMHCDAVLLTGNCILNESMLTGESVPVTKTAVPNIAEIAYDPKEHARHTLFCGTHVIQTRYFGNEKVLAIVVRTAFSTSKGSLVRSILYPPPVDFRFEKDSYKFVTFLILLAAVGFVYTIVSKALRGVSPRDFILEALDLITITVPPALPAAMTVGRYYAQRRLQNNNIFCISPRSINVSGSIDCVCFDKTGTLTEDGLDLLCVVPIENNDFKPQIENVELISYNTLLYGLVSCHSLTIIDKQIVGDPLDLKMFESTKWAMEEPEVADNTKFNMIFPTVLTPPQYRSNGQENIVEDLQIGIIREFPFSSSAQRMGVIMRRLSGTHFEYYCKGSPEMILKFAKKESVPPNFDEILESYTQEGYRVIAIAHKELKLSYTKVQKVQREAIEKDLNLLGLIVLENRLKPLTTPCIQDLNDANIRIIMVTGDNILTALSVAKDCEIVTPGQSIITVNCDNSYPPNLVYTLTSNKVKLPTDNSLMSYSASIMSLETMESQVQTITNSAIVPDPSSKRPSIMLNNYRFAMTGKVWGVIRDYYPELIPRICTRGTIFARMAPDQKQQLVQELQGLGYCVAMCGDGANDCGALRAAHTGISLSEAESSVASPFTSRNPNITCVLNVIKEGRAALVTSFGIFKYMAAYSLCQLISVIILYSIESNLTDIEYLYIDLFIISIFAFFFGRTESYPGKLVKETPLSSLVSVSPIVSLFLQILLLAVFQVTAFEHLKSETWYVPLNATFSGEEENVACLENYTIYTISSFQYIILAVVFSKGYPYRKSIFTNYGLVASTIFLTGLSVYLALIPHEPIAHFFELVVPQDFTFRLYLVMYAAINFVLSIFAEHVIIEKIFFKRLRFKFHNIDKSKRKYLAVERDLRADRKWPVLTSDFKSAVSPSSPQPVCPAQFVIEQENRFDKNHILNKLYDASENQKIQQQDTTRSLPNTPARLTNNFVFRSPKHLQYQMNGTNETGYFSQDDLFSSLPSENQTSTRSDTYKSISDNTNYDLASSNINIPELPFDGGNSVPTSPIKKPSTVINIELNGLDDHVSLNRSPQHMNGAIFSSPAKMNGFSLSDTPTNYSDTVASSLEHDNNLSQFNKFGTSPPQNIEGKKHLEMNTLDTNR
ncbi:polyamine-transporting ATPase 13A3-like isoform X3 [Diabrotica virgifera virgifera]|uniref:Cation-transporting ATPase n=1 Tax=Diabrotica virgifera virgifera TaxID=50390 RepID=A0ABM5JR45_DIAVI|nr:polyamine-transporting ATPase 13A3-like isoform X2 [Diabrotica virgifera virgifera]XP_050500412.1 polyamine-transporting ATPase 13A3-like isoform X3 [Diabrotica virgifera virgifera]